MNTKLTKLMRTPCHLLVWPGWLGLATALLLADAGANIARAQTAAVATDHGAYYPGETIVVSFNNGPGNPKDWIGIYPEGVEPGSVGSTLWLYVDNTQSGTKGLREGSVTFSAGLNLAGTWVAFLLLNDGYTKLANTTFTVVDPSTPLVRLDKRIYALGETIKVAFTNGPGNAKDWIGIYQEGQTPGGPPSTLWFYVDGTQNGASGLANGVITFTGGLRAVGNYTAFLLLNDGYDVLASEGFAVAEPVALVPRILSLQPANNASNLPPVIEFVASITNGVSKVVSNSVVLIIDGATVTHHFAQQANLITITYTNDLLFAPNSTHTAKLMFSDNASPANSFTNAIEFMVANYRNIILPTPLYFEDFDGIQEGQLPAGWTEQNYTDIQNPELDFGNLDSAIYAKWTVVEADRFLGSFITYSDPGNPQDWEDDYHRVLSVNPLNIVNGKVLNEPLAKGRFLFGNSGYRNGRSQVLYLFTPDFDLSGKSDIYLSFHSLWEQNQDSIGAVEYSVDQGQNWLPIVYMLHSPDVVTTTDPETGAVSVDAVATFNTEHSDVAFFTDEIGAEKGGTYGAFIAAPISQDLAPFISIRVNDDPVESKRVELFRLPQADNKSKVRFRFAHAGTDSWYFGVDDFGLYSIPTEPIQPPKLVINRSANNLVISWPTDVAGFTLEYSPALTNPQWSPVGGVANNSVTVAPASSAAFYRLRK
jgi:hypothetical protein